MTVMNYLQSFLPNGLVNANGYITTSTSLAPLSILCKWNFETKQWNALDDKTIQLDHNGVANGLYKFVRNSEDGGGYGTTVSVYDADRNLIRRIMLPLWNDEKYDILLNEVLAAIANADKWTQYTAEYAKYDKTLFPTPIGLGVDITESRGWVLAISNLDATAVVVRAKLYEDDEISINSGYITTPDQFRMFFNDENGRSIEL